MVDSELRREVREDIAFADHCPTTIIEVADLILSRGACMSITEMSERDWRFYVRCLRYRERYLCRLNGHDDMIQYHY